MPSRRSANRPCKEYHDEITGQVERGYHGHGPAFRDECNRIGKELGLPPVGTAKVGEPLESPASVMPRPRSIRPPPGERCRGQS
jgi:hypothetical protein